jgi:hypothetical protein
MVEDLVAAPKWDPEQTRFAPETDDLAWFDGGQLCQFDGTDHVIS